MEFITTTRATMGTHTMSTPPPPEGALIGCAPAPAPHLALGQSPFRYPCERRPSLMGLFARPQVPIMQAIVPVAAAMATTPLNAPMAPAPDLALPLLRASRTRGGALPDGLVAPVASLRMGAALLARIVPGITPNAPALAIP